MMKLYKKWIVGSTIFVSLVASATVAYGNPAQTPLQSSVSVSGNTGGAQQSECGYVSNTPTQVIRVTEAFAPLRFRVQGDGAPTLLIVEPNGQTQCLMADSLSGGSIDVPGLRAQGTYSLYVGDRNQGSFPYTLSITQEN